MSWPEQPQKKTLRPYGSHALNSKTCMSDFPFCHRAIGRTSTRMSRLRRRRATNVGGFLRNPLDVSVSHQATTPRRAVDRRVKWPDTFISPQIIGCRILRHLERQLQALALAPFFDDELFHGMDICRL